MQRACHFWFCLEHWCCCLLAEGAVVNFSGEGDCHLFDVVITIDAQVMRTIMPHASMSSTQRAWDSLLKASVLNFCCSAWLSFVWCCCCHHHQKRWWSMFMLCWLFSSQIVLTSHLTLSTFIICHNIFPHLQVRICNTGDEETALAVYWVMDGVDRCQIGFISWHLVKHGTSFIVHWYK